MRIKKGPITRTRFECSECGSRAIVFHAFAEWDDDAQDFVLAETFDRIRCRSCESDTSIATHVLQIVEPEHAQ